MAVTYTVAVKNSRLSAVVAAMGATSKLEIGTAGMAAILGTISLDATPGTVASGVLTFTTFPKTAVAAATGTAAAARIRTATGGTDIVTGLTVGLSASDIIVDSVSITAGQTIQLNSASITHS